MNEDQSRAGASGHQMDSHDGLPGPRGCDKHTDVVVQQCLDCFQLKAGQFTVELHDDWLTLKSLIIDFDLDAVLAQQLL